MEEPVFNASTLRAVDKPAEHRRELLIVRWDEVGGNGGEQVSLGGSDGRDFEKNAHSRS